MRVWIIRGPLGLDALGRCASKFCTKGGPKHHQAWKVTRKPIPRHGPGLSQGNERLVGFRLGEQTRHLPPYDRAQGDASAVARLNGQEAFINVENSRQEVAVEPGRPLPGMVEDSRLIAWNHRDEASIYLRRQRFSSKYGAR
jgi:hypothetical protein